MKNLLIYTLLILCSFTNCDYVDNPIPEQYVMDWSLYPDADTSTYPWPNWTTNNNTIKRILLEDYTGTSCNNCPDAAEIADQIEADNNGVVIVATIHANPTGSHQQVTNDLPVDFQTTAGTEYSSTIPGFLANPMGTINRKGQSVFNTIWFLDDGWVDEVNNQLSDPLLANIQVEYNYYSQTNGLFVHTETEFKTQLDGDYHLIIYLIRDTVIAPQKTQNTIPLVEDYPHHAVLTDNINGTWGALISSGAVNNGDKFYNDYTYHLTDPTVDSTFKINNLSLITYVCERNTFEIIQVEKTKLAP